MSFSWRVFVVVLQRCYRAVTSQARRVALNYVFYWKKLLRVHSRMTFNFILFVVVMFYLILNKKNLERCLHTSCFYYGNFNLCQLQLSCYMKGDDHHLCYLLTRVETVVSHKKILFFNTYILLEQRTLKGQKILLALTYIFMYVKQYACYLNFIT